MRNIFTRIKVALKIESRYKHYRKNHPIYVRGIQTGYTTMDITEDKITGEKWETSLTANKFNHAHIH